jgi:hypothetical protein
MKEQLTELLEELEVAHSIKRNNGVFDVVITYKENRRFRMSEKILQKEMNRINAVVFDSSFGDDYAVFKVKFND